VLRPSAQVHIELFSAVAEADRSGGFTVVLARSKREFMVPPGETILGILRNAGANVSYSCEEGVCGTCETAILSGMPDHRDAILSEQERASGRTMMICCSGSKSDRLVLDL
jgi:ferredoxin